VLQSDLALLVVIRLL